MGSRRKPTEERKQELVDAALLELASTPLSTLSTRQLARRLGVSQPALFRHFRSREALLTATAAHALKHLRVHVAPVMAMNGSSRSRLQGLALAVAALVEELPGLPRLLFALPNADEPKLARSLAHLNDGLRALVTTLLNEAQVAAEVPEGVPVGDAALLFLGMIQGAVHAWQRTQSASEAFELAPRMAGLFSLWWRAIGGTGPQASGAPEPGTNATDTALAGQETEEATTHDTSTNAAAASTTVGERVSAASSSPGAVSPPCVTDVAGTIPDPLPPRASGPNITHLDVRPILASGRDPLEHILRALDRVSGGDALMLTVPFRPTPLLALLARRGHGVHVRPQGSGVFAVVVVAHRDKTPHDLTDLEPPEPLEIVLTAAAQLGDDEVHLFWLPRYPQMLVPQLASRSVLWAIHELHDGVALVHLRGRA